MNEKIESSSEFEPSSSDIGRIQETLRMGGWMFFDIDGTLESNGDIPRDLISALTSVRSRGIELGIATGRCLNELSHFLESIGDSDRHIFTGWLFAEDVHVVVEPDRSVSEFVVTTHPETLHEMRVLEEYFTAHWHPVPGSEGWGYIEGLDEPMVMLAPYPYQGSLAIWEKGPVNSPSFNTVMQRMCEARDTLGLRRIEYMEVGNGTLRVLQNGLNKAVGISMLANRGILDLARTVYFGDGKNDIPAAELVLKGGGSVVCPSNGVHELQTIATYTTIQPDGLGVLDVMNRL
jgi:HAD superfamily hydrolase (TIGR01484 family)